MPADFFGFDPADFECPKPPPPEPLSVCKSGGPTGGVQVIVDPSGLTRLVVTIRCGESLNDAGDRLSPCVLVTSRHVRDGIQSDEVALGSDPNCIPVSEPSFGLMMAIGVLCVTAMRYRQRSRIHGKRRGRRRPSPDPMSSDA